MSVAKIIEVMGSSKQGWEDATRQAIKRCCKTLKNVKSVDVKGMKAKVDPETGEITEYKVRLRVAFVVE